MVSLIFTEHGFACHDRYNAARVHAADYTDVHHMENKRAVSHPPDRSYSGVSFFRASAPVVIHTPIHPIVISGDIYFYEVQSSNVVRIIGTRRTKIYGAADERCGHYWNGETGL